jgi:hypothetical protein
MNDAWRLYQHSKEGFTREWREWTRIFTGDNRENGEEQNREFLFWGALVSSVGTAARRNESLSS